MKKYKKIIIEKIFYKIIQQIAITKETTFLGSAYGGWHLIDNNLSEGVILSAGVGEDVSFDVDFINRFGGVVIFIDPTPRALEHLSSIENSLGNKKTTYAERKKAGIEITRKIITNNNLLLEWLEIFNKHKKKDDLADSFLQGHWYLKNTILKEKVE